MSSGGFFGGFAEGFGSTYGRMAARRQQAEELKLREVLADREQQRFEQQQALLRDQLNLDKSKFEFEKGKFATELPMDERKLSMEERQAAALAEHQAFSDELQKQQQELDAQRQDLEVAKTLVNVFDPKSSPGVRKVQLRLFAMAKKIDIKSPNFKELENLATSMDDEELKGTQQVILRMLPDAKPGEVAALVHQMATDPAKALGVIQMIKTGGVKPQNLNLKEVMQDGKRIYLPETEAVGKEAPSPAEPQQNLQLKEIYDPSSPTGRKLVPEEQASGMPSPAPMTSTPEEKARELENEVQIRKDYDRAEKIVNDAEAAKTLEPEVDAFKSALASNQFQPGTFSGLREGVGRMARFFGLDNDPDIRSFLDAAGVGDPKAAELMNAAANRMGLALADKASRVTNMSLTYIKDAMPSLMKTKAGNEAIVLLMERTIHRQKQMADIYNDYINEYGTLRPKEKGVPDYFTKIRQLDDADPIVNEDVNKKIQEGSKEGQGVDLKKLFTGAEKVTEDAVGKITESGKDRYLNLGNGKRFKVVGNKGGNNIISTEQGDLPVIWDNKDIPGLDKDTQFIWGPTGSILKKTAPSSKQNIDNQLKIYEEGLRKTPGQFTDDEIKARVEKYRKELEGGR